MALSRALLFLDTGDMSQLLGARSSCSRLSSHQLRVWLRLPAAWLPSHGSTCQYFCNSLAYFLSVMIIVSRRRLLAATNIFTESRPFHYWIWAVERCSTLNTPATFFSHHLVLLRPLSSSLSASSRLLPKQSVFEQWCYFSIKY